MNSQPDEKRLKGEAIVLERVRAELQKKYKKDGETLKHVGGGLYRISKVLYYVLSVWYFIVLIINSFILSSAIQRYTANGNIEKTAFFRSNAVIVTAMFIFMIISLVLMLRKKNQISCCFTFASMGALMIQFVQIASGSYIGQAKMMMFYAPAAVLLPVTLVLFFITLSDNRREKKAYDKELSKVYQRFSSDNDGLMTNEKWQQIIEEYEEKK